MLAYLEALVLTEPWLYLREIRDRLENDLNLQPHEVPGITQICMALTSLELCRKKVIRVAQERFTPGNLFRRDEYNVWKHTVNMNDVDEWMKLDLTLKLTYGKQGDLSQTKGYLLSPPKSLEYRNGQFLEPLVLIKG